MTGAGFAGACGAALVATWALCEAWQAVIPKGGDAFAAVMTRRVAALLGRTVLLLAVVATGIAKWHAEPGGLVLGAALGWLLAAGREAIGVQRKGRVAG